MNDLENSFGNFLDTNPEFAEKLAKQLVYKKYPEEEYFDIIRRLWDEKDYNGAIAKCFEGTFQFKNHKYKFLRTASDISKDISDFEKAIAYIDFALITLPYDIEDYTLVLSGLFFDKYLILMDWKKFPDALNELNNSLLLGTPLIKKLIFKISLLIDLNNIYEAKFILNSCFQSIKSTTKDDYSNLASLYRLRLRLNEIEGNKEEIERDEAKILECLDKSLPF